MLFRSRETDRPAPVQWKTWLGDYGTLRGYRAGELAGDRGAWASLDLRLDFDLWRTLQVPGLKSAGLQPLLFADWGWTENRTGPVAPGAVDAADPDHPGWGPAAQDWRAGVGFGFGRRFDLPGFGGRPNLRFYAAYPVEAGSDGHSWRFLVGLEP